MDCGETGEKALCVISSSIIGNLSKSLMDGISNTRTARSARGQETRGRSVNLTRVTQPILKNEQRGLFKRVSITYLALSSVLGNRFIPSATECLSYKR